MPDLKFDNPTPCTEQDILDIEGWLGRELPEDYQKFAKEYGGCFVDGEFDGSEDLPIDVFYKASAYRSKAIVPEWQEYKEIGALPFAKCLMGNVFVLTKNNAVHHVNYYGGKTDTEKLTTSFGDFISRIQPCKSEDED